MRIIDQLSEDTFVVKLSEKDLDSTQRLVIAHDYVMYSHRQLMETEPSIDKELKLHGKYALCSNAALVQQQVQIDIRTFIKAVLPIVNTHPYCQESHLKRDGKDVYIGYSQKLIYRKDGVKMIAVKPEKATEFTHIPYDTYELIKKTDEI